MSSPNSKEKMDWMYGGPSKLVDREAYLLGRKLDKNFELHGTDRKETSGGIDAIQNRPAERSNATTLLDLHTIRKEDPLVAIKVREDKVRREIIENPMKMKKLQEMVMGAMEKKMKKYMKKQKKSEKKRRRTKSSSSEDSSPSPPRRRTSDRERSDRSGGRRESFERRRSRSPHSRNSGRPTSERRRSRSPRDRKPSYRSRTDRPERISSPKKRKSRSPSHSDSDTERRREKYAGFGLVKVNKDSSGTRRARNLSPKASPVVSLAQAKEAASAKSGPRRKLTEKEMEEKRREMTDNAKWRDDQRTKNLERIERRERDEREHEEKRSGGANFVRPMLSDAAARGTVADRIKRNVHNLQRGRSAMDTNFARK